ncbi:hypothetical protein LCGC14_0951920 [marine sediment metagenome]|uniref:Uncharacterized protein n=1 Tax=marine sediment metagenome TaxID=412755 RepID=A0A0F9RNG8_9ZZZZ
MSEEKDEIKKFEYTTLVKINPKQSTLPIDTAAEWTKGYMFLNMILLELAKDTYVEEYIDEVGEDRRRTHIHPQMLPFLQERRRLQEQIWKISGGEAVNEGKKEFYKKQADFIFQMSQDVEFKEKHKKNIRKILEAEIYEET